LVRPSSGEGFGPIVVEVIAADMSAAVDTPVLREVPEDAAFYPAERLGHWRTGWSGCSKTQRCAWPR
jgi:hypothetical protein